MELDIDTGDAKPFKLMQYLMSPYMLKILIEELDEMLQLRVVEPSDSPWNSPVLLVKKKYVKRSKVYLFDRSKKSLLANFTK